MNAHNSANIASQVPAAGCDCQIFNRVEAICVDHKIAIILVDSWCFAPVPVVEELGHSFTLDFVNSIHVEPGTVAGKDNRVSLRDEMVASSRLNDLL